MPQSRKVISSHHRSVVALLAAHRGSTDPKELIRRLARSKIAYAKKHGWEGPPFCPKIFTSLFDIRCKEVVHDIGGDGRILVQRGGRLLIEYRAGQLPERQRFTIFHEFAHTLFPDFCDFAPHHKTPHDETAVQEKDFEHLCDIGAAEMLLPYEEFTRDLQQLPHTCVQTVHSLRVRYGASIDATIYRLIDFEKRAAYAAAFLTDQKKEKFEGAGPLWVNNHSRNRGFRDFIWPGTMPPANSIALKCYEDGVDQVTPTRETWLVKGEPKSWMVQAVRLPSILNHAGYPKVVVLLGL
jgi:Zn-dependent peptidase ImmA (M78 family)